MPGCAVNAERCGIGAAKGVCKWIPFRIGSRDCAPNVCAGSRILGYGARRAVALGEGWCFVDICHIDRDVDAICQGCIRNRDRHRIGFLCFIVECGFCLELPRDADDTKRCGIGATEGISQGITGICIGCRDRCADVLSGCGVLCDGACRAATITEHGCVIGIRDVDSDINTITAALAIGNRNRDGVFTLCFIVECCLCFQLSGSADDTKRCGIGATEGISQGITGICIGCRDRCADVLSGCGVLRDGACRAATISDGACRAATITEHGCVIGICDTNSDINSVTPTLAIRDGDGN